jgi:hypothetical protein
MTSPDLVDVQVPPEQVRAGDRIAETGDDEAIGPATIDRDDRYVAVPMRSGGAALLPRDRLVTVRRPRPTVEPPPVDPAPDLTGQLAEVRDLALALADSASPAVIKRARDKVAGRITAATTTATAAPAPAAAPKGKP